MNCTDSDSNDCDDINLFIIIFSILLSISYLLILLLSIFLCYFYYQYRRKEQTNYQRMRETRKEELFPNAQESTAEANPDTSMTEDSADPKNGRTPAPKRGVDVSMDNPNYMSNSTIRVHQEKDTKRVSVISQSHQRNENPQRVSKVDPKVSYSALDHPIVVVEEVRKSEEDDVYSLADESEHNYSCISNDPSQNSRDDREDRDSVHDYSCISNNSRLSTSSSNVSNDPNEACPIDIEPADYEDFYSIPNAGDNISESEGENETEGNKGGHEKEGEEEKQEEQSDVNNQPEPPDYPSKETSVEATDKASKIKRRSATSSDIFNVQSTQSLLAVHPSDYDSRLTRLQGIEGRSGSAAAVPGSPYKPVPKPRVLRKTAESTAK